MGYTISETSLFKLFSGSFNGPSRFGKLASRGGAAKKSYVGATDNITRRLKEHNSGKHSYTQRYLPWEIIYTETFETWTEARNREVYLKSRSGRKYLKEKIFRS